MDSISGVHVFEAHAGIGEEMVDAAAGLLSQEVFNGHPTPKTMRETIRDNSLVLATDDHERVVGAGVLTIKGVSATISSIAVEPEMRGNGLGSGIIGELELMAESAGVKTVCITPTSSESAALYGRLGYRAPNGDAVLYYEKPLEANVTGEHIGEVV